MFAVSAAQGASSTIFSNFFITLPVPEADFAGQVVIVTGSNTGLGFESSRHLLRLGVTRLIMAVRSVEKGEAAREELLRSTGREASAIEVWHLDMESFDSVKAFAARAASLARLDGLLANAGIATTTFSMAEDNERTMTVNVVSTFLLILLLLPQMQRSSSATGVTPRVVIPNSALHYMVPLRELDPSREIFAVLNDQEKADMTSRYPLSKLVVIYVIRELAQRLQDSKKPQVIFNTPNPSYCKSQLMRENDSAAVRTFEKILARSTEMGSRALVDGLVKGEESNGQYLTNCHTQKPAPLVLCGKGPQIQKKIFDELLVKLEAIYPGIMAEI